MDAKIDAVNQKLDNLKTAVDKSEKEILSEVHSVEAGLVVRIHSYEEDFNLLNADIGVRLKYEDTESKKDRDDNQRATATIVRALNVLLRNTRHDEMVIPNLPQGWYTAARWRDAARSRTEAPCDFRRDGRTDCGSPL